MSNSSLDFSPSEYSPLSFVTNFCVAPVALFLTFIVAFGTDVFPPSVVTFTIVLYSVFLGVTCGAGAGFGSSFLGSCGFATTGGRVGSGWRRIFSFEHIRNVMPPNTPAEPIDSSPLRIPVCVNDR